MKASNWKCGSILPAWSKRWTSSLLWRGWSTSNQSLQSLVKKRCSTSSWRMWSKVPLANFCAAKTSFWWFDCTLTVWWFWYTTSVKMVSAGWPQQTSYCVPVTIWPSLSSKTTIILWICNTILKDNYRIVELMNQNGTDSSWIMTVVFFKQL